MKLMIASDLHGAAPAVERLLDIFDRSGAERLLLLGDILYHGPRNDLPAGYDPKAVIALLSPYADRLLCVRGNCDAEVDQMVLPFPILAETALLLVDGRTWFCAHGHRAGANPTANDLPPLAPGSVFLSGHTHIPTLDTDQAGILRLNPGSISIPKGGFDASYALYKDGRIEVRTLAGAPLMAASLSL